ncbi:MobF family relaxase, partial [Pseudonocardia sp. KRD291]|uniref:MobF family relaxase n=1 Tax=Pseudonocardia sp. KRD291 TaxID=2792007 RepID=UPI001C4A6A2A
MLRISAISAGAVEYLVRGSGCTDHEHSVDLDEGAEQTAERSAGMEQELGGQGPAYFEAAVSHGEPEGRWFGTGLEAMGINARSGEVVDVDDVRAVFGQLRRPESSEEAPEFLGRRPPTYKTEEQRLAALVAKEPGEPTPERLRELETAAATDGRKGVAYYDFTFSAPKSVSVYWAALLAAGADEQAAAVAGAHDKAVEIAISYAEQHVAYTRTGWHGRTTTGNESVGKHEAGQGTVWTLWRHSTSRENEPQLHTHGALLNRTVTADGKIGALDGRSFRAYKEAFASAYERALEQLTTEATGARFAERADGVAREIVGVDPELMAEASTRRGQVTARVDELVAAYVDRNGYEPGPAARKAMADMATLDTRAPKGTESGPAGVAAWSAARVERLVDLVDEVAVAGHDPAELATGPAPVAGHAATAERAGQELGTGPVAGGRPAVAGEVVAGVDREAVMAAAVADAQAQYSVWTIGNLSHALDRRLGDAHELGVEAEARPALLEALAREALASTGVVQVSAPDPVAVPAELQRVDGGSIYRRANGERYATAEHLTMEDHLVTMTRAQTAPAIVGP